MREGYTIEPYYTGKGWKVNICRCVCEHKIFIFFCQLSNRKSLCSTVVLEYFF